MLGSFFPDSHSLIVLCPTLKHFASCIWVKCSEVISCLILFTTLISIVLIALTFYRLSDIIMLKYRLADNGRLEMNKKIRLLIVAILIMIASTFTFVACGNAKTNDGFLSIPQFENVNGLYESLLDGSFKFYSATVKIIEYDDKEKVNSETMMYLGDNIEFSDVSVDIFGTGVKSHAKMYVIPDLTENCTYVLMNNFMTNGWSYSKTDLELADYDADNFATVSLKSLLKTYLDETTIDLKTIPVKVENNTIAFEIENEKYAVYNFNATSVSLPDELKDYKSKC